jgi:hypothetical protein
VQRLIESTNRSSRAVTDRLAETMKDWRRVSHFNGHQRGRAEPKPLAKGEIRVRESTSEEKREAEVRKQFLALAKANPDKPEAEIAAMMAPANVAEQT